MDAKAVDDEERVAQMVADLVRANPENAWKHDRQDSVGKEWRMERHSAKEMWEPGMHPSNLLRFCSPVCEMCAEEREEALVV